MIAENFRLYDVLNCSSLAVAEAESERPERAQAAWHAATAVGMLIPGSPLSQALAVIIAASAPDQTGEYRAWLWNALDAASLAVLPAMEGDRETTALCLPDAECAASLLPPDLRDAMTVVLGEIRAMAETAVAA